MQTLSESGQKVFNARYAARDEERNIIENFEQAVLRLARTASLAEKDDLKEEWELKFADMIGNLLLVPSTPIWANMGKSDRPWQPGACFVLDVEDSLEGMYETLKQTALIFKSGGGIGYNFSRIRPRGDLVRSTKGQASGVVELIKLYDSSSNMVVQGGTRRGASIGILNVDHPEIVEFVVSKLNGDITNFNLSVGISDKFMEALEKDQDWELTYNGTVYRTIPVRELWELICNSAHACGDPGMVFLDRLQDTNPVPSIFVNAVNPCVTGDTWVFTSQGPRQVKDLLDRQLEVLVDGEKHKTREQGFFKTGTKQVVRLTADEGYTLRLTTNHMVLRVSQKTRSRLEYDWVPVSQLQEGDQIRIHNHRSIMTWPGELTENEGYLLGLLVGDGTFGNEDALLDVWPKEKVSNYLDVHCGIRPVMDKVVDCIANIPHRSDSGWCYLPHNNKFHLQLPGIKYLAENYGICEGNKTVTAEIEQSSYDGYCGFLRGLFDSDGAVIGTQQKGISVTLAKSDLELLQAVQRMLLRLGIASAIYENRRTEGCRLLPNSKGGKKEYHIKTQHELVISEDNILVFAEHIGFINSEKQTRLKSLISSYKRKANREKFIVTVKSIEGNGIEDVYDVQVPDVNCFDANGIYAHNCGEIILAPGESCLLSSINLAKMVSKKGIDWDLLKSVVAVGVRFLDNMIDVAQYPLDIISENTRRARKLGLGYTGLTDALILSGVAYDSGEGRQLAGKIAQFIQSVAHDVSIQLGKEKGNFPAWEDSIYYPDMPHRNAALIGLAPTGSVTTMAGCEGYGIEPLFAVAYQKETLAAGVFDVFSPLFVDACQKYNVPASVLSEVARKGSCQGVDGVPEVIQKVFRGAQEIDPVDHLLMQAELQKYVDNAISKTCNLPNSATVDDVSNIYRMAHELKIKGVTIFRDGSKRGTVNVGKAKTTNAKELRRGDILPRPVAAHGLTHRLDTGCGKIYLTVNYRPDTGEILETFITTGSDGGCQVYTEATSRLISLSIRGGIPVEEVVGQLQSTHSCPSYQLARGRGKQVSEGKSCASAIAKKLKEIKDQLNGGAKAAQVQAGVKCEMCGNPMDRAEGCYVCRECGYSRC